jgi:CMP-N-acetylneuraminic acid synthetase
MNGALVVIPARGGSKRLPRKNLLPFLGRPLIAWTIEFALRQEFFTHVCVSTDCPEILSVSAGLGATVSALRPAHLASDEASTLDVVRYEIAQAASSGVSFDSVAILQPTTPYRQSLRWVEAAQLLSMGAPGVVGVTKLPSDALWAYFCAENGSLTPCFPEFVAKRSQELPPIFAPNGSMYWVRRDVLESGGNLVPDGARAVAMGDSIECIDIDTAEEFSSAEDALRTLLGVN